MNRLVVFAVPDFEPTLGGTSRQTGNLARAFLHRGYDVAVVTQRVGPDWPRVETLEGVSVHRLGPRSRGGIGMKLFVLHTAWWLRRRRRDVAIVQVLMYPDLVVSAKLAGLGARTVMCWAGLGDATDTLTESRMLLRIARRWAIRGAPQIALTPALARELERAGVGREVTVIPIPVDLSRFRAPSAAQRGAARARLGVDDGEFVVLYCGHMRALKRVESLVRGFAQLVDQGIDGRLVLVGSSRADLDDSTERITQEILRLDLAARVTMTGAVDDVVPYLHAADVFALPSDREGLSNGLVEALACGLPCVAPLSAGGDQILDETCGLVPPTNEPEDLAAALLLLARTPERRAAMGEGAARRAQPCGLATVADQYLTLYATL